MSKIVLEGKIEEICHTLTVISELAKMQGIETFGELIDYLKGGFKDEKYSK